MRTTIVGNGTVSVEATGRANRDGRPTFRYRIEGPGVSYEAADLAGPGSEEDATETLLSFLMAAGEGLAYERVTRRPSDLGDLFPREVAEWADANATELEVARIEAEEAL